MDIVQFGPVIAVPDIPEVPAPVLPDYSHLVTLVLVGAAALAVAGAVWLLLRRRAR